MKKLEPEIDRRIELISVIFHFSRTFKDSASLISKESPYRQAMSYHFQGADNHSAVSQLDQVMQGNQDYWNVMIHALRLDNRFQLTGNRLPDELVWEEMERAGETDFSSWAELLALFSEEYDFDSFFNERKAFYSDIIDETQIRMKESHYASDVEEYFKSSYDHYRFIISPLTTASIGPRLVREDQTEEALIVIGLDQVERCPKELHPLQQQNLCWHEYSHSFVNPVGLMHGELVNNLEQHYSDVSEPVRMHYRTWQTYINELVVVAVTIRLTLHHHGSGHYNHLVELYNRLGWARMDNILKGLQAYEESGVSFKDFYPELLKFLD